jgi:phytoene dehydrogenase-like protein
MMEKAYKSSVANFISTEPYLEVLLPSMIDSTQSCGRHITASVFFMYSKFSKSGEEALKGVAAQRVLAALRGIYENFDECVDYMDIKTSNGLSNRFGFTFGNVDHGSLVPDYSLNSRGLPGYRPPTTDLDNLFLASAGAMPGGLVSGVPGVIAAKAIGALS